MQTEALYQSLLSAFKLQRADQDDDATMARALTDILVAFAGVIASAGATSATTATVVGSNEPMLPATLLCPEGFVASITTRSELGAKSEMLLQVFSGPCAHPATERPVLTVAFPVEGEQKEKSILADLLRFSAQQIERGFPSLPS